MISTPFTSFVGENGPEYGYISIDVTSAVQDILTAGAQFIGFRLSTETDDRFELGRCIGVPEPVLTVVPEPASLRGYEEGRRLGEVPYCQRGGARKI